jgi:hypothetical protein
MPADAGIQTWPALFLLLRLDSRIRGNDTAKSLQLTDATYSSAHDIQETCSFAWKGGRSPPSLRTASLDEIQ